MKAEQTRVYRIDNLKEIRAAERKKAVLENKYNHVRTVMVSPDKVQMIAWDEKEA